jgi:plasmid stabilization system protein ParE
MKVTILDEAEDDLELAFNYYESQRAGLGVEFITEYRHGLDLIITYPNGWRLLDDIRRCYRLRRFPYGIIYRFDAGAGQLIILTV